MRTSAVVLFMASTACASTVYFTPLSDNTSGAPIVLTVSVEGAQMFNMVTMGVGASEPVDMSFQFNDAIPWVHTATYPNSSLTGMSSEIVLDAVLGLSPPVYGGPDMVLGTLTVRPTSPHPSAYCTISVNGLRDGLSGLWQDGNVDLAVGSYTVPEPATLSLLAMGGLFVLRRRKVSLRLPVLAGLCLLLSSAGVASADVLRMGGTRDPATGQWTGSGSLEFVTVGDPGNAGDSLVQFPDGTSGYGAVDYAYQMGKYDVTAAQYCEFLNAVAATDTYGLYNSSMASPPGPGLYTPVAGCGILRTGDPGSYRYTVDAAKANFPANFTSWGDAARFCNWLANGQPNGPQGPGTTENGSYTLDGAMSVADLLAVTRNPNATYVIPSENEWYKAAFYKGGGTNAGYWLYSTQSDSKPSNVLSSTGANNVNFYDGGYTNPSTYLTPVGYFAGSPGPYGTFDMGGDVWQWNEAVVRTTSPSRSVRGGAYFNYWDSLVASHRGSYGYPTLEVTGEGFRVALVPEPVTFSLFGLGGLLILWRPRMRVLPMLAAVCLLFFAVRPTSASVFDMGGTRNDRTGQWTGLASVEFVTVGDAGNAADSVTGYGAVGYSYKIAKYDVTAGQYCQFLNAVAASDPYGVYTLWMAPLNNLPYPAAGKFGIVQKGSSGTYTYSVTGDPNFPINYITWGDAARFCNWLANGQPTGPESKATTEAGSYDLNGAMTDAELMVVTQSAGATYVIPTADEWYKAAYYREGGTDAGYWLYPTQSDSCPSNIKSSSGTSNANYWHYNGSTGYTDPSNYLTAVGYFAGSPGPYGTFDQAGDVCQWNERAYGSTGRFVGGGAFSDGGNDSYLAMQAGHWGYNNPTNKLE